MPGRLESINASRGGVPKRSMFEALITEHGLDGDRQRDLRFHGGPDRAIVLFSLDVIRALQREGHTIAAGTTGENLTVSGIDWTTIVPGIELASRRGAAADHEYHVAVREDRVLVPRERLHAHLPEAPSGWSRVSARVLAGGLVAIGDPSR